MPDTQSTPRNPAAQRIPPVNRTAAAPSLRSARSLGSAARPAAGQQPRTYFGAGTPRHLRDVSWIRGALQTAVALEQSTMPLYCAAMYSLEVQNYPSYNTIRSVL